MEATIALCGLAPHGGPAASQSGATQGPSRTPPAQIAGSVKATAIPTLAPQGGATTVRGCRVPPSRPTPVQGGPSERLGPPSSAEVCRRRLGFSPATRAATGQGPTGRAYPGAATRPTARTLAAQGLGLPSAEEGAPTPPEATGAETPANNGPFITLGGAIARTRPSQGVAAPQVAPITSTRRWRTYGSSSGGCRPPSRPS